MANPMAATRTAGIVEASLSMLDVCAQAGCDMLASLTRETDPKTRKPRIRNVLQNLV